MMDQHLDDSTIYPGVDCNYYLWDEQQNQYVPAHPVRLYSVTLKQALNKLITSLETDEPLVLNPDRCAYTNVQVNEVEIPEDVRLYLVEHPEVSLNPASPVVQAALRIRMRSKKTEVLTDEQRQQRDYIHW